MADSIISFVRRRPKLTLIMFIFLWLLILASTLVLRYYTSGVIEVTTNNVDNIVEISRSNDSTRLAYGVGFLSKRLPAGDYTATVSNRSSSVKKQVHIIARATASYSVSTKKLLASETVLSYGAYGIVSNESSLFYVDMRDNVLYKLSAANAPVAVSPSTKLSNFKWGGGAGVGLGENNKDFFSYQNGALVQLNLPFSSKTVLYDIASDGTVVVSDGKTIYKLSQDGSFSKLFTVLKDTIFYVLVGNNRVLLGLSEKGGASDDSAKYSIVGFDGKTITTKQNINLYNARWSPDGKILVIANPDSTVLYDNSFATKTTIPQKNVLGLTWQNNSTLLFALNGSIFSYDIQSKLTSQLVSAGGGSGVSGIYLANDGTSFYFLTEVAGSRNAQGYTVQRVRLNSPSDSVALKIAAFFPIGLDQCSADYVNFVTPTLVITPYIPGEAAVCQQNIQAILGRAAINSEQYEVFAKEAFLEMD